jgi:hypothetical protein
MSWIRGSSSSCRCGVVSWACWKTVSHLTSWRNRIRTFLVVFLHMKKDGQDEDDLKKGKVNIGM